MRTIYRLNGEAIALDVQRTIDGVTYPNLKDVWQSVGVTQHEVDDYPDPEFFTWLEYLDGTLSIVAIPAEQIAQRDQERLNQTSLRTLSETDWYVVRFAETGTPIPDDIKAQRQAARDSVIKLGEPK